jgi:putative nucleotidyltransferase with HDIG domain
VSSTDPTKRRETGAPPPPVPKEAKQGKKPRRLSPQISLGFALMSLVPILLALYLLERLDVLDGGAIAGETGLIVALMIGAALSGFFFIRSELVRIFREVLDHASRANSRDICEWLWRTREGEIDRISGTIQEVAQRFEDEAQAAARARDRLRAGIAQASEALQASRDAEHLLTLVAGAGLQALGAARASLLLADEQAGEFVTRAAADRNGDDVPAERIPFGEGMPGLAARERKPLLLRDLDYGGLTAPQTLAAPLIRGESIHGVLVAQSGNSGREWNEDDLLVLANLALLAASAFDRTQTQQSFERDLDEALTLLATAIEERDPYARGHAGRVARICEAMARTLRLDETTVRSVRRAAILHDVGKYNLPDSLLRKDARLAGEEEALMRSHPVVGERMVRSVGALSTIAPMIRHHHELCDGSGYPDGLRGDEIPLTTHILIVANAFDVMTSDRSYRQAGCLDDALEELKREAGKRFDRRAVHALVGLERQVLGATANVAEGAAVAEGRTSSSVWVKE